MAKARPKNFAKAPRAGKVLKRRPQPVDPGARAAMLEIGDPATRPLRAYAFDPGRGRLLGNQMSMDVRYERLDPGPVVRDRYARDTIAIIDYDASNEVYYEPVNLDDPAILIRGGLEPRESDPRFHQQMVYAVVTETIQHFEAALGRRIHWRRDTREPDENPDNRASESIYTLNIFPHAMVSANAFYSPRAHGILFGYFRAVEDDPGGNLPGQMVYTCLSHDIVVHETTHAIIDGIRGHFTEPTNPDVCAFHEAFADLAALFRHFSHEGVLFDTIQRTGGMLHRAELASDAPQTSGEQARMSAELAAYNPLIDLARQFGEATGRGKGLRSALGAQPSANDILTVFEPHARGAILVAAVFDAYFKIYLRSTADLFRIYRAGGGALHTDLPVPLASQLAHAASSIAQLFFNVCVRALDYCPPVDITFGDYLRAVITADLDVHPNDDLGLRDAFMQACRVRGILPDSAFFSDTAIAWPAAKNVPPVYDLEFGDPSGLTDEGKNRIGDALRAYLSDPTNLVSLGFDPGLTVRVRSFHPFIRTLQGGTMRTEMVVEAVQTRDAPLDATQPGFGSFPMRGGATLIIGKPSMPEIRAARSRARDEGRTYVPHGNIRYVIGKHLHGAVGAEREARQRQFYERSGLVEGDDPSRFTIDFALAHGE